MQYVKAKIQLYLYQGQKLQEYVYCQLWPGHDHRLLLPDRLCAVSFSGYLSGPWALVTTYLNGRQQNEGRNFREKERFLGLLFA